MEWPGRMGTSIAAMKQYLINFKRGHPQRIEAEGFHQHQGWYEFFGCPQAPMTKVYDATAVAEVVEVKHGPSRDSWSAAWQSGPAHFTPGRSHES